MKILSFSDIYLLNSPVEKLQSIIQSENIDIVILMGGLFPRELNENKKPNKASTKKNKRQEKANINILELNWLLIPVLVNPDQEDLKSTSLIRQVQGQEAVWIRYIHNKGTIIDSWFIFSVTEGSESNSEELMKSIENYSNVAPDRSILLYIGDKRISFPNIYCTLLSGNSKSVEANSFLVSVDTMKDETVTIIDLEKKTVNSILVQNYSPNPN